MIYCAYTHAACLEFVFVGGIQLSNKISMWHIAHFSEYITPKCQFNEVSVYSFVVKCNSA